MALERIEGPSNDRTVLVHENVMGTAKATHSFSILNKCHAILDFMNQYQQCIIPIPAILIQAHDTHVDKYNFPYLFLIPLH